MSKTLIVIVGVAAVLVARVVEFMLGDSGKGHSSEPADPAITGASGATGETAGIASTALATEGPMLNGLNLTAYTPEGYASPEIRGDLQQIKDIGSTTVTIVPPWYMKSGSSNQINPSVKKTPSDSSLESVIAAPRQLGLMVILKPHIDVLDGTFRGDIQPDDREKWFKSYSDFIGYYADSATMMEADVFSIGTN